MGSLKDKVMEIEREEILHALRETEWVMARAARRLGITERMIGYKIRKYGIRKEAIATTGSLAGCAHCSNS
ncbi:MAG TPA: helix-turn-helix domain-containing protein [Dissulfurispiraceae bacterium]|nr:helix-turn-helix domain-containing protein [Dissulfurispiraceae bacterium]